MLAARDQENLVHAHQTGAAGKPLNQGTRHLQPKTPGNKVPKTPFRIPVNDENNPLALGDGKQTVRGPRQGNGNTGNGGKGGKDGVREKLSQATPGTRNRAPLGMKTTNAKAKAFQTPAPPLENAKPARTAKRTSTTRKAKQNGTAQQSNPVEPKQRVQADEDRDIEYMPPKPQPLPDIPDDIVYDTNFPQFKGQNFARGWQRLYEDNEVGEDGLTQREREEKKASDAYDKKTDEEFQKQMDNMELLGINVREFPDEPCAEEIGQKLLLDTEEPMPKKSTSDRAVPTVKSRNAAKALAQQPQKANTVKPKPSTAPRSRITSALGSGKRTPTPTNPSSMRHTAAIASSRNTMGYSKGRNVASALREQTSNPERTKKPSTSNSILSPEKYVELYGEPPFGSEMWSRCKAAGLFDPQPNNDTEELLEPIPSVFEEDEESANFQLTLD